MTDEVENIGAVQEIATPETSQQETPSSEAKNSVEDRQDRNWKEMRRKNEDLQRKIQMQEEMLTRVLQTQTQPQAQQAVEEPISDDDYIQGSQYKKLRERDKEEARRAAREEAEKILQHRDQMQFMDKLKRQFSDFDDIVNPETLSLLEESDPDLANTIAELKDPYKIGLQSYKYIKATGLAQKAPSARRVKEVERKIDENSKTVQSPQAFDKRPMAQAFKMTEAEKNNLYKEMMQYASAAGGGY